MNDANAINSEIKALLILMLLKSGTRAEEIQTALQMAAVSRLMGIDETAATAQQPTPPQLNAAAKISPPVSEPVATDDLHLAEAVSRAAFSPMTRRTLSPKQIVRNEYLAPIKGYAA